LPATDLIEDRNAEAHFAVRRFDRTKNGRLHVHTLAGLLHADFRTPSLDYVDLMKVTSLLTRQPEQVEEAFRRMVFNVLVNNRDDHAKNHAFLMNRRGGWRLSPAYDLTPSEGPGGEHNMTVAGEGKTPTLAHFMKVANAADIPDAAAKAIIDRVADAVSGWKTNAKGSGLGAAEASGYMRIFEANLKSALGRNATSVVRPTNRAHKNKRGGIAD
jgi:serine/threonine-protein kinase HipA